MPTAQSDFHLTIDRAAGLTLDACCSARAAAYTPLPSVQDALLKAAIVGLEHAQRKLFEARQEPWPAQP